VRVAQSSAWGGLSVYLAGRERDRERGGAGGGGREGSGSVSPLIKKGSI
jgi:hypothetical protein